MDFNASGRLTNPGGGDYADFYNGLGHLSSNIVRVGFNYKFGASTP